MPGEKFSTPEINLLAGDDFSNQTQSGFLRWALTWGKRIVVLTELIVILAFLSRFWLDTTVADLNDQIIQKKAIVSFSQDSENRFRVLAGRVNKADVIEKSVSVLTIYDQMQALIPGGVQISQIKVTSNEISFSGAGNETDLSQLVNSFRSSKNFINVNVEKISKKEAGTNVEFSLKASYAK